jgi:hypothetical protein
VGGLGKKKRRLRLKDEGMDAKIVLKLILEKQLIECKLNSTGSR